MLTTNLTQTQKIHVIINQCINCSAQILKFIQICPNNNMPLKKLRYDTIKYVKNCTIYYTINTCKCSLKYKK